MFWFYSFLGHSGLEFTEHVVAGSLVFTLFIALILNLMSIDVICATLSQIQFTDKLTLVFLIVSLMSRMVCR